MSRKKAPRYRVVFTHQDATQTINVLGALDAEQMLAISSMLLAVRSGRTTVAIEQVTPDGNEPVVSFGRTAK